METVQAASRSLYLLGRYKAAVDSLNQIDKAKESSDWKHHLYLGQCYKAAGHTDKASKHFSKSLEKSPNVDAYVEMADLASTTSDKSKALQSIKKGLELFPESHKLSLKHGEISTDSLLITRKRFYKPKHFSLTIVLLISDKTGFARDRPQLCDAISPPSHRKRFRRFAHARSSYSTILGGKSHSLLQRSLQ